jgi:hypothetical protein
MFRIVVGNPKGTRLLGRIGMEEGAVPNWFRQKQSVFVGTGFSWIRIGSNDGLLTIAAMKRWGNWV